MRQRIGGGAILALLLGAFVVALAYGIALPILPFLLERRLGPGLGPGWHTGLLTATYTFALFLFAPLWGRLSDRWSRRRVILIGLAGFAAALVVFAFIDSLFALYVGRFLSGAFAAAVVPVALAMLADWAPGEETRARQFTWLNISGLTGSLAGPAIGGLLGGMWNHGMRASGGAFLLVAAAAAGVALFAALTLPREAPPERSAVAARERKPGWSSLYRLLLLALLTAWAVGTFEVGLALRAKGVLNLGLTESGFMFVECMLVMALAQALAFNRWVPSKLTRWLLVPAFVLLAASMLLLSRANALSDVFVSVAVFAAGAGVLSPVIGFWVSMTAGNVQGEELGRQTSAASLGQALGSAAGGLLIGIGDSGGAFLLAAIFMLVAAGVAWRLSFRLAAFIPPPDALPPKPGPHRVAD